MFNVLIFRYDLKIDNTILNNGNYRFLTYFLRKSNKYIVYFPKYTSPTSELSGSHQDILLEWIRNVPIKSSRLGERLLEPFTDVNLFDEKLCIFHLGNSHYKVLNAFKQIHYKNLILKMLAKNKLNKVMFFRIAAKVCYVIYSRNCNQLAFLQLNSMLQYRTW